MKDDERAVLESLIKRCVRLMEATAQQKAVLAKLCHKGLVTVQGNAYLITARGEQALEA